MVKNEIQRKLKAIFIADVQGYSKLMGDDDEQTVNTITTYRKIIAALIEKDSDQFFPVQRHFAQPHFQAFSQGNGVRA